FMRSSFCLRSATHRFGRRMPTRSDRVHKSAARRADVRARDDARARPLQAQLWMDALRTAPVAPRFSERGPCRVLHDRNLALLTAYNESRVELASRERASTHSASHTRNSSSKS